MEAADYVIITQGDAVEFSYSKDAIMNAAAEYSANHPNQVYSVYKKVGSYLGKVVPTWEETREETTE